MASPEDTVAFIGVSSTVPVVVIDRLTLCPTGVGVMGYPMAASLRSKTPSSCTLLICDVSQDALSIFRAETAGKAPVEVVSNGFEAVRRANTVITMLPTAAAVEKVYLDPGTGIIAGTLEASKSDPQKKLLMEYRTIETATILKVAQTTVDALQHSPRRGHLAVIRVLSWRWRGFRRAKNL
ncbi:hypothetical protein A1O1_01703 [Capronia coronata CBS 617.96]|uniref:3-hydroxyisobutyrate dehydrogenase n=1 Tax=Capronia coronata CBS 617.96 TaxID=1182541 RepID=W9YVL5_9EURO|nr:uncharacterized protein A1O1_01703 [Capronia coronata CBS 617.96]EXJ93311.1 hypothetical protein A1O1_01703 [Capronia coronata CBS 617.96]